VICNNGRAAFVLSCIEWSPISPKDAQNSAFPNCFMGLMKFKKTGKARRVADSSVLGLDWARLGMVRKMNDRNRNFVGTSE
jgi:hypothetical protein